jgi:Flp pilus assembly pilin Flp
MKRKLLRAQGMVEYALLLTMVTVPMIVVYATLGEAAGEVWQAMVDGLSDTHMFEVKDYSLIPTTTEEVTEEVPTEIIGTPVPTNTLDPFVPTEIPTETQIPPTATQFVPATYTFTPEPTGTATSVPTAVPTATPSMVTVSSVQTWWNNNGKLVIGINVNTDNVDLSIYNVNLDATKVKECSWYCKVRFVIDSPSGGYITITSTEGDNINVSYPPRGW